MDPQTLNTSTFAPLTLSELRSAIYLRGLPLPSAATEDALVDLLDRHTYINHHLTQCKPFQGGPGRDPATLVGLKIEGVEINNKTFHGNLGTETRLIMGPDDPVYLTLHCSAGETVTITATEPSKRWAAIRIDENLAKAFERLDQGGDESDSSKRRLEILEAAVATRGRIVPPPYTTDDGEDVERHNVIGIRCEGMSEIG